MSEGFVGYDPQLVAQLDGRVRAAIDDLAGMTSADPAAADAVGVAATVRVHLESSWVPMLHRIAATQAMAAPIEAMSIDDVLDFLRDDPLGELTSREREVLAIMAEGRSNAAIASRLWLTERTVESHIRSLFAKLGLVEAPDGHRRVLAVLAYLSPATARG